MLEISRWKEFLFPVLIKKNVKGTGQCVIADNLGVLSISGFGESFYGQCTHRFCLGQCFDNQLNDRSTEG